MTSCESPGPRRGPLREGEKVQCTDRRGHMVTVLLVAGSCTQTPRGMLRHDDLIGACEGTVVLTHAPAATTTGRAAGGWPYVAMRPRLADFVLSMPRGAQIMYPKDIAQVLAVGDIRSGMRVLESGAGSGALSAHLIDAVGASGTLVTVELRPEFARVAEGNVTVYFGRRPTCWRLVVGGFDERAASMSAASFDRVVLDMLDPWNRLEAAWRVIAPGGVLTAYVTTTTQMSRLAETMRASGHWTEPVITETLERRWKAEGLAVRPEHAMVGHTGFVVVARAMAPGNAPLRRRERATKHLYDDVDGSSTADGRDGEQLGDLELRTISDRKLRKVLRDLDDQVRSLGDVRTSKDTSKEA